MRLAQPHEIAALLRLVAAIQAHRVVRERAAEVFAPALLRVVGVGARIDQELAPADRQREGERIGMAVRRDRGVAKRPGIDYRTDLGRGVEVGAEDEVAALGEALAHRQPRRLGLQRVVSGSGAGAEQPARAIVERARFQLEVAAAK